MSQFDEYSKLADIPELKKNAFPIILWDQPAYRAIQRLRIPENTPYQVFLERITTCFDSGKSQGDYKPLLRAPQQNTKENINTYADNLVELDGNAHPDADPRFNEEIAKKSFFTVCSLQ